MPRRQFPVFATLAAVLAAIVIVAAAIGIDRLLWHRAVDRTAEMNRDNLERDAYIIEARMRTRINDLALLRDLAEAHLDGGPRQIERAIDALQPAAGHILSVRQVYEGIRLFSLDGRETFRLNFDAEKQVSEKADSRFLENEADSTFFKETLASPPQTITCSPLELNTAQGKIETPPRPVMRISTVLLDRNGKPTAIMLIRIDGTRLLQNLSQFGDKVRHPLLLNREGYWILGEKPESEWAFMFPERREERLQISDPELWQRISSDREGDFVRGGRLYNYRWVDSGAFDAVSPRLLVPVQHGERLRWCLVKVSSPEQIWSAIRGTRQVLWICTALLLLTVVPGIVIGTHSWGERNRARQELQQILDTSIHGLLVVEAVRDAEAKIVSFRLVSYNAAAEHLSGIHLNGRVGEILLTETPGSASNPFFELLRRVTETGRPSELEHWRERDGQPSWCLLSAARFHDGVVVNFADITEIKQAQESLQRSEGLLTMASKLAKAGAWQVDFPSKKCTWSSEVYSIHEVDPPYQPVIETAIEFFPPESRKRLQDALDRALQDGIPFDLELELITGKGRFLWVRCIAELRYDEFGEVQAIYGVLQDITATKEALTEAQELSHAALAAEQAKANFLAVMSHEIRTPMNGILGFAELLYQRPLDPEDRDAVCTIRESGRSLLRILNDILDFSSIESGRLRIEARPFSPAEVIHSTQTLLLSLVQDKRVTLRSDVSPHVPAWVLGDAGRVRQVLLNLAGNALKFTPEGSVTIGVRRASEASEDDRLEFFCEDTGGGIPSDKLVQIFDPFTQADNSIARRYGGTGLGLAISRSLVEIMGGVMSVESTIGVGSSFEFTLPLPRTTPEAAEAVALPAAMLEDPAFATTRPLRILAVDDDATNLKLLSLMLRKLGYQATLLDEAGKVLDALCSEHYDCAIIDIHMPEIDGLSIASQLRALEVSGRKPFRTYLIAFSADVLPEDQAGAFAVGIDDYLTKPLSQAALAESLRLASLHRSISTPFSPL